MKKSVNAKIGSLVAAFIASFGAIAGTVTAQLDSAGFPVRSLRLATSSASTNRISVIKTSSVAAEPSGAAKKVLIWQPSGYGNWSLQECATKLQSVYRDLIPSEGNFAEKYPDGILVDMLVADCKSAADIVDLPSSLDDYALVFVLFPNRAITDDQVQKLKSVVARGGRIVLQGENGSCSPTENKMLTALAKSMGAHFEIASGALGGGTTASEDVDVYNRNSDLLEEDLKDSIYPRSVCVAPIVYSGIAQEVARMYFRQVSNYAVWAVDEVSDKGRITAFSDANWYHLQGDSTYVEVNSIPFFERLLSNAIANEQKVLDEEDPNKDIEEKVPDGMVAATRDENDFLTYYSTIAAACTAASQGLDVSDRLTVVLKRDIVENFTLPEGVVFETTGITTDYAGTISVPSGCELTVNDAHDVYRCVSVHAPGIPVVSATDGTYADRVEISWTTPESDKTITGYKIRCVRNDNGFEKVLSSSVTANSYSDTSARSGVHYTYYVMAQSSVGWGTEGSDEGWRSTVGQVPDPVLSVAATGGDYVDRVEVTWQGDTNSMISVTRYEVLRRETGTSDWTTLSSDATGASYTDTTAEPGVKYDYAVCAGNDNGWSTPVTTAEPGWCRVPKRPMSLVINGPDTIDAGATNLYTATVSYNDGTSAEKTLEAVWSVTPSGTVAQVVKGDADVKLTAAWTAKTGTLELTATYSEDVASQISTVDLVAHYEFNGSACDSSVNRNDGIVHGATLTADKDGNPNCAYAFSGSGQWIEALDSPSLRSLTNRLTVCAWIRQKGRDNGQVSIINKSIETGDRQYYFQMDIIGWHIGNGAYASISYPTQNEWHHCALTSDGTTVIGYLDGVKKSALNHAWTSVPNTEHLEIGRDCGGGVTEYFIGDMDDLRIYNRALTAEEIAHVYAGTYTSGLTDSDVETVSISGTKTVTIVPPKLTGLEISGPDTVEGGLSTNFTAIATYDDGTTQDVTDTVTWSVTPSEYGTISTNGVFTAKELVGSNYNVRVTASLTQVGDETVSLTNVADVIILPVNWDAYAQVVNPNFETDFTFTRGINPDGGVAVFTDTGDPVDGSRRPIVAGESYTIKWPDGFKYYDGTTYDLYFKMTPRNSADPWSWEFLVMNGNECIRTPGALTVYKNFDMEVWLQKGDEAVTDIDLIGGSCYTGPNEGARPYSDNGKIYTNIPNPTSFWRWDSTESCWSPANGYSSYYDQPNYFILGHGTTADGHLKGGYKGHSGSCGAEFVFGYITKNVTFRAEYPDGTEAPVEFSYPTNALVFSDNVLTVPLNRRISVLPDAALQDQHIDHWYLGSSRANVLTPEQLKSVCVTDNLTVTAVMTTNQFTVTFSPADGSTDETTGGRPFVATDVVVTYGCGVEGVPAVEKPNSRFLGWSTNMTAVAADFPFSDLSGIDTIASEHGAHVVLYSVWIPCYPVSLWVTGPGSVTVGSSAEYHAFVAFADATTNEVTLDTSTAWSVTPGLPKAVVAQTKTGLVLTPYAVGTTLTLSATYTAGTISVNGSLDVTVPESISLPIAVDLEDADISTGGTSGIGNDWYGLLSKDKSHDHVDVGRSGKVFGAGESWMSTVVTNAGDVSFWWKTSCESAYDYLKFEVDGEILAQASGTADDWRQLQFEIPSGTHTLRWTYVKDGKNDVGEDCGWVDQLVWTPLPTPSPVTGDGTVCASDGTYADYVEVEWSPFDSRRTVYEYELSRKSDTSGWEVLTSSNILRFVDTSALPGVDYTYRVRARNEAGWGTYISDDGWRAYSLTVDPQTILTTNAGCETSVVVTANADWEVAVDDGGWTTIAKESESVVRVDVAVNELLSARTNHMTVAVGGTSAHATNVDVVVVQTGRPAKYDVGFIKPYEDWRTRMQIATNTTEEGVYAPVSVFTIAEPLDISFGWTNRSEVAVSMPSIRFRLYAPDVDEPVSEWNAEGRAGEVLEPGEGAWSGAWPFVPLKVLKPGDYRLEVELAPDMNDINREGELDSDKADNIAIFRFAVRDPSLALATDVFGDDHWKKLELTPGNDFAQPPHAARRTLGVDGASHEGVVVQFGPYVPMNGVKISGSTGHKALDLVLLVDDSISMGEGIAGLVKNISDMVDELLKGNVEKKIDPISDLRIKVVGYYDYKDYDFYGTGNITRPWFKEYPFSTDPDTLKQELAVLRDGVSGGSANDGESSFDALYYLCKGWTQDTFYGKPLGHQDTQYGFRDLADASRVVLIFTDEPPHCLPYEDKNNRECNVPGCEGLTLTMMDAVLREAGVNLMIVGDGLYQGDMGTYTNGHKYKDLVDMDPDTRSLVEPEPADRYRGALAKMTADATFIRNLAGEVSKKVVTKITKVEPSLSAYAKGSGVLTFSWCNNSTSTAGEKNTFSFECDGGITNLVNAVGEGWKTESLRLEEGSHTFKWSYGKIDYEGAISDCGLIGDIVWEPDHTQLSITPKFFSIDHPGSWESRDEDTNKVIRVGEGDQKVRVTCNSSWTVVTNDVPDWITFVTLEGVGDGEILFQVATNETHELRKATVIVRADEYALDATNAYVEQEFRVEQKASPYVEDGEIHILSVGVKPRWPWNDKVDIDFRVMTPKKTGTPVKITFFGVNNEGGDMLDYYPALKAASEVKPKSGALTNTHGLSGGTAYVTCPTSGLYRVTWNDMAESWYSSYPPSSVGSYAGWKKNGFHSPAFSVRLKAECSGEATVELPSDPVRVDMRQNAVSASSKNAPTEHSGGAILTGVEKIGHPDGKVDPVAFDTTDRTYFPSNGWNKLDFVENLGTDQYSNRFDRACVINDAHIEGGMIMTNTIWRADKVHVIRDNVFVHKDAVLTIEDGAVVKFCYNTFLFIYKNPDKSGVEEFNICMKGCYLTCGYDDSYGGNTLYYNAKGVTGDTTEKWNGLTWIPILSNASSGNNFLPQVSSSEARAATRVSLQCKVNGKWASWKDRFYSRGQHWGNLPRPSEAGKDFFGWYCNDPATWLTSALSPDKYPVSKAFMIAADGTPFTAETFGAGTTMTKVTKHFRDGQIFALICPVGWATSVWDPIDASEGHITLREPLVVYDGKKHVPTISLLTINDAEIATENYEATLGAGDYISAGSYSVGVDFKTADYANSPSVDFVIEQRPIDGGEIRFSNPTNGVLYLPGQKKPTVTVHLPDIGNSVIADSVATRDAKITWLDSDDHVWPEVGDYMVVASYEDNPNYTGGAITNVFTVSVNPDYVFTEYCTLDEVADQIEVFKSKYGRNPRIIRFSGRTNDVLSLDWKDKIRGNTALNDFVSTNFICWADNTAGDPGIGVRAIADLERDIVSTGGVLSVSQLFDFLSEALVAKELPVDASLAELSLVGGNSFEYNGSPHQPTVAVALGGVPISSDEYDLVYSGDGVAVGTYSVYAVFNGASYCGETEPITYSVTPKTLTSDDFSLDPDSAVYDGTMHKPSVNADGVVCTIDYGTTGDFTAAGTYPITVTSSGNHTGSVTIDFVVSAQSVDAAVIELDQYQVSITEKKSATNLMPHVLRVYDSSHTNFVPNVDYTLDFGDGGYKSVGTYTITATFCGNYAGTATATFVIDEAIPVVEPVSPGGDVDVPSGYDTAKAFANAINSGTANKADYLKMPSGETTDAYLSYFSAVPSGDSAVIFALNDSGTNAVENATEEVLSEALSEVLSSDGSSTTFEVSEPLVGFYYSLKQGSDLGTGLSCNPGDRNKLGGRDTISFELNKSNSDRGFYQIIITPTEYSEK